MEELVFYTALIGFFLCSLFDLKTREVPDYLSYFLLGSGVLYRIMWFFESFDLNILFYPFLLSFIFGIFSYILYKSGQWGGGDVKLIIAAAWLIGYFPSKNELFFINFFMNLIIFGTIYTMFYTILKSLLVGGINKKKSILLLAGIIVGMLCLYFFQSIPPMLYYLLPLTIIAAFAIPYLKEAEEKCFIKYIPAEKLTEGDWLVEEIKGVPKRAEGVTMEDIEKIKKMKIQKVKIKEGVPFLPAFFISLILTWIGMGFLPVSW